MNAYVGMRVYPATNLNLNPTPTNLAKLAFLESELRDERIDLPLP